MLPVKFDICHAFLIAGLVYDYRVARRNRRINQETIAAHDALVDKYNDLVDLHQKTTAQALYLADLVDRHEIGLDAFDRIALANPIFKSD